MRRTENFEVAITYAFDVPSPLSILLRSLARIVIAIHVNIAVSDNEAVVTVVTLPCRVTALI
jgi:hypothetical protein